MSEIVTEINTEKIKMFSEKIAKIKEEIAKDVVGQADIIDGVITAIIAGGNVLLEGVPGVGKTRLVRKAATETSCVPLQESTAFRCVFSFIYPQGMPQRGHTLQRQPPKACFQGGCRGNGCSERSERWLEVLTLKSHKGCPITLSWVPCERT